MTETFWAGTIPAGTSATTVGSRSDGIQFTVSATGQLSAIGVYIPAATQTDGTKFSVALYSTTNGATGTLLAGWTTGSGTFTAGAWNFISIGPVTLSTGVTYVAVVSNDDSSDGLQFNHGWWGSGAPGASGITSSSPGTAFAPSQAAALGGNQQPLISTGKSFPNTISSGGTWYGVDIQFSAGSSVSITGVGATATFAGGVGSPSGGATVTGVGAAATLDGGIGAPSIGTAASVTGVGATATFAGGVGAPSSGLSVVGVGAAISAAGGIGSPSGGATVTGIGATPSFVAGVGTPVVGSGVSISGVGAIATMTGGIGTQSLAVSIQGVAASAIMAGGIGSPGARMALNPDSILDSVKKMLGLDAANTAFDLDVVVLINSSFGTLNQIGVGPPNGYSIFDNTTLWTDFITRLDYLGMVKAFTFLDVKLAFDPPDGRQTLPAMKAQIEELKWRINIMAESTLISGWWILDGLSDFPSNAQIGDFGFDSTTNTIYVNGSETFAGYWWDLTGLSDFPAGSILGELGYDTSTGQVWRKTA